MSEGVLIALITTIGSLLGGIIGAYAPIINAAVTNNARPKKGNPKQTPAKKYHLWKGILSGVLVGAFLALVILSLWSSGGGGLPTPTIIVTSVTSTPDVVPILLQLEDSQPFNDTLGVGMCVRTLNEITQLERVNAIGITFNNGQNGYCGLAILLNGYNLSENKQITFWVKGEKGGEKYKVGIRDMHTDSGKEPKLSKVASADWTQVFIQLDEFMPHQDLSSLVNFSLSFESGSGKIYVDQLIFAP